MKKYGKYLPGYLGLTLVIWSFLTNNIYAQTVSIPMVTQNNALVLQVDKEKNLKMVYYGVRLANPDEYSNIYSTYKQNDDSGVLNNAYTPSGSTNLAEPAITVTHADGNKSLNLSYVSHQLTKINDSITLLVVTLKDPVYDFDVKLYYKTYYKQDVTEQWSVINTGKRA